MGTTSYGVNYDDERFVEVEEDKQQALTENEQLYGNMIDQSGQYYDAQIEASKQWAEEQKQLQQEQTDFAIEQIEQQKEQAKKDYTKEQSGAYTDWQKQSNRYGASAEELAASGLTSTGYSESSQVSMYNTYQNRVATARESYNQAVLNYDNSIKDAQLQNNSALAEIAYNALQQQLELSLQGFQYKNTLLLEQASKKQEIDNTYYGRYQDVVNQINTENALAEQIRQYEEQMAYQKEQDEKNYQLQLQQLQEEQRQFNASLEASRSSGSSGGSSSGSSGGSSSGSTGGSASIKSGTDIFGNSAATQSKKDFYFSNGYQPQYINNTKLLKTGVTVGSVFGDSLGIKKSQNIWVADGKYYVWDGTSKDYIDVSNKKDTIMLKLTNIAKK